MDLFNQPDEKITPIEKAIRERLATLEGSLTLLQKDVIETTQLINKERAALISVRYGIKQGEKFEYDKRPCFVFDFRYDEKYKKDYIVIRFVLEQNGKFGYSKHVTPNELLHKGTALPITKEDAQYVEFACTGNIKQNISFSISQ